MRKMKEKRHWKKTRLSDYEVLLFTLHSWWAKYVTSQIRKILSVKSCRCTVYWGTSYIKSCEHSHHKRRAPEFTCKRTETHVFRRTRICLIALHLSLDDLSHLPKWSKLSQETNSGPFKVDQTGLVWKWPELEVIGFVRQKILGECLTPSVKHADDLGCFVLVK